MLLPLLAFLVGVQAAFPPDPAGPVPTFSGLELLTGGVRPSALSPDVIAFLSASVSFICLCV